MSFHLIKVYVPSELKVLKMFSFKKNKEKDKKKEDVFLEVVYKTVPKDRKDRNV